jgi:hypothetical protein
MSCLKNDTKKMILYYYNLESVIDLLIYYSIFRLLYNNLYSMCCSNKCCKNENRTFNSLIITVGFILELPIIYYTFIFGQGNSKILTGILAIIIPLCYLGYYRKQCFMDCWFVRCITCVFCCYEDPYVKQLEEENYNLKRFIRIKYRRGEITRLPLIFGFNKRSARILPADTSIRTAPLSREERIKERAAEDIHFNGAIANIEQSDCKILDGAKV